uniref:E3 ubiquitin-protein ligase RKP n=1 Tax=Rhizophora mucronata TaxID=61149 RepID=A0A2P2LBE1_RHIMU
MMPAVKYFQMFYNIKNSECI